MANCIISLRKLLSDGTWDSKRTLVWKMSDQKWAIYTKHLLYRDSSFFHPNNIWVIIQLAVQQDQIPAKIYHWQLISLQMSCPTLQNLTSWWVNPFLFSENQYSFYIYINSTQKGFNLAVHLIHQCMCSHRSFQCCQLLDTATQN
jgi:hypothetical protein